MHREPVSDEAGRPSAKKKQEQKDKLRRFLTRWMALPINNCPEVSPETATLLMEMTALISAFLSLSQAVLSRADSLPRKLMRGLAERLTDLSPMHIRLRELSNGHQVAEAKNKHKVSLGFL